MDIWKAHRPAVLSILFTAPVFTVEFVSLPVRSITAIAVHFSTNRRDSCCQSVLRRPAPHSLVSTIPEQDMSGYCASPRAVRAERVGHEAITVLLSFLTSLMGVRAAL